MKRYFARLCWNSCGWQGPTREVKDLKLEQPKSYALSQGFGHEEWLFDFTNSIDGYQYGFLQPVHSSDAHDGEILDVILYTIAPSRERVLVAKISRLEVLTKEQQSYAFEMNTKNGRIERMRSDLKNLDVDPGPLGIGDLFNIRFHKTSVSFQEQPYPELPSRDFKNLKRYDLYEVPNDWQPPKTDSNGHEKAELPLSRSHMRKTVNSTMVDDRHLQLQKALYKLLQKQHGSRSVFCERQQIDLSVRSGSRNMLIEIKPYPDVRQVLREALGQVIEYAHWPTRMHDFDELVIVGPAAETVASRKYLELLRKKYKLPISYCTFSVGDPLPKMLM